MTIKPKNLNGAVSDVVLAKRPYNAPVLLVFGRVAALTQGQTGCDKNDNACTAVTGTMGNKPSDQNIKEKIVRIGNHSLGVGVYLFDYKAEYSQQWGAGRQFGVMAQEVEAVMPEAVCVHPDGYKMVNYAMIGISYSIH